MTAKRVYSQKLYHTCLEFLMNENQDYMSRDYQSRYMDMLMEVMSTHGTLNEKLTREYREAENAVNEVMNSPVMKELRGID
jgi:hypothetical protein